jgi:hypothetical protein
MRQIIWLGGGWGPITNSEMISSSTVTYGYLPIRTNVNFTAP